MVCRQMEQQIRETRTDRETGRDRCRVVAGVAVDGRKGAVVAAAAAAAEMIVTVQTVIAF